MAEIVIHTCPKCGADLIETTICTYPPIPSAHCPKCGWYWEGRSNKVVRVPFNENHGYVMDINEPQIE